MALTPNSPPTSSHHRTHPAVVPSSGRPVISFDHRIPSVIQTGAWSHADGGAPKCNALASCENWHSDSIWGGYFEDEFVDGLSWDREGRVGYCVGGTDQNGSQWFVTVNPAPHLNNIHVIFGQVVEGMDVVRRLSIFPTEPPKAEPYLPIHDGPDAPRIIRATIL